MNGLYSTANISLRLALLHGHAHHWLLEWGATIGVHGILQLGLWSILQLRLKHLRLTLISHLGWTHHYSTHLRKLTWNLSRWKESRLNPLRHGTYVHIWELWVERHEEDQVGLHSRCAWLHLWLLLRHRCAWVVLWKIHFI